MKRIFINDIGPSSFYWAVKINGDSYVADESILVLSSLLRNETCKNEEECKQVTDKLIAYVIADDGAGNPFIMDADGKVLIYYHDNGESEVLAKSLGEFIDDNFEPW